MTVTIAILGFIAFVFVCIVILAILGYYQQKRERKWLDKYNQESINSFMNGQKNKKYDRQSTPKVPTMKKVEDD